MPQSHSKVTHGKCQRSSNPETSAGAKHVLPIKLHTRDAARREVCHLGSSSVMG